MTNSKSWYWFISLLTILVVSPRNTIVGSTRIKLLSCVNIAVAVKPLLATVKVKLRLFGVRLAEVVVMVIVLASLSKVNDAQLLSLITISVASTTTFWSVNVYTPVCPDSPITTMEAGAKVNIFPLFHSYLWFSLSGSLLSSLTTTRTTKLPVLDLNKSSVKV